MPWDILPYVTLMQDGVFTLRCAAQWPAAFPLGSSCTSIACSKGCSEARGSAVTGGTFSCFAFSEWIPFIRKCWDKGLFKPYQRRQVPQEPLALWVGPSSEEGLQSLPGKPQCLWLGWPVGTVCFSRVSANVTAAAMELFYLSDFCVFLRPSRYLYRSEVSSSH